MRKIFYTLLTLLLVTFPNQTNAADDETIEVMGIKINMQFCQQFDKIAGIVSSFSSFNIPVVPGGLSIATIAGTNPVLDVCQFLTSMKNLDLTGQLFETANLLNEMTGEQFTKEISLVRDLNDISTVVLDENGAMRSTSQIFTRRNSRKMNRFYKDHAGTVNDYLGTSFDTRTRSKVQSDLSRMSRLAYRRSLNEEVLKCPRPDNNNKNYADLYEKEVVPQEENVRRYEPFINHFRQSLMQMGSKIMSNEEEHSKFLQELSEVEQKTYRFNVQVINTTVESKKKVELPVDEDDPTAPRTKTITEMIDKKYQVFCGAKSNPDDLSGSCSLLYDPKPLQAFIEKYDTSWKTYTSYTASGTAKNLLNSPMAKVEDNFKDYSVLCNKGEIRQRLSRSDPNFDEKLQAQYAECVATTEMKMEEAGSLFSFYSNELARYKNLQMMAQAHIYTFESYYLGTVRTFSQKSQEDALGLYTQEEVKCAPMKNLAAINIKLAESMAINAEINQVLLESAMEANIILKEQQRKERQREEMAERRRALQAERKRRQAVDYNQFVKFPDMGDQAF